MKLVIQRVHGASCVVDGKEVSRIGKGLLAFVGVADGDTDEDARLLATKIGNLRIFCDEAGKMNLSVKDVGGEALIISQFTLLANYKHGNRPDYLASAPVPEAKRLYEYFVSLMKEQLSRVECGIFGADMKVSLINDGPVTIVMDSEVLKKKKQ